MFYFKAEMDIHEQLNIAHYKTKAKFSSSRGRWMHSNFRTVFVFSKNIWIVESVDFFHKYNIKL